MARLINISILLLFVFLSQPVLGEEILNRWISENTEISALLQTEAGFGTNEGNFQKLEDGNLQTTWFTMENFIYFGMGFVLNGINAHLL